MVQAITAAEAARLVEENAPDAVKAVLTEVYQSVQSWASGGEAHRCEMPGSFRELDPKDADLAAAILERRQFKVLKDPEGVWWVLW